MQQMPNDLGWSTGEVWQNKVNTSRIYQLHKDTTIIVQGTDNNSMYFSKLRHLWVEFDSMIPPPYDYAKSKGVMKHMEGLKVL